MECVDWFAEMKVCGKDPAAIPLTVLLHLDHLFIQNLHLFNVVGGGWVPVIGGLYSVQYKSIFGAPDKVRRDTCDRARLLSQV